MDGVSAVATVAGLVTAALQSCKVIYLTISAIRDRPKQTSKLSASISGLERILNQVVKLIESAEQCDRTQDVTVFEPLRPFLVACKNDLAESQARLAKLNGGANNKIHNTWSVAKNVLGSNEYDAAHATITRHLQVLSIQLEIAGSQLHLDHGNILNAIDQTASQTYIATEAGLSAIGQYGNTLGAVYKETQELRVEVDRAQQSLLQNSGSVTDQLLTRLDTLSYESNQQHDKTVFLLQGIQQETRSQKSLDRNDVKQSRQMYGNVVEELQSDPQQYTEAHNMPEEIDTSQNPIESKPGTTTGTGSSDYIDRLCLLSSSKQRSVTSGEAEVIIEDLESLLLDVMRGNQIAGDLYYQGTKRTATDTSNEICSSERAAKRFRRALTNSIGFEINKVAPRRASAQRTGLKISYQGSRSYSFQGGTLAMSYVARSSNNVQSPEECVETLDGTLSLLMPHQPHRTNLNVWFSQRRWGPQFDVLPSTMSFQSVRPDGSAVFGIASFGSVEDLVKLFEADEAYLSDCDSKGRSLLNYALRKLNVPVCKFLVEHHADVESLELPICNEEVDVSPTPPLLQTYVNDFELEPERLPASIECQKILLEAGSDPTNYGDSGCVFISNALHDTLRLYLDQASHFIDLKTPDKFGKICLLELVRTMGFVHAKCIPAMTLLLLECGADIHARDEDHNGCFHVLFRLGYRRLTSYYPYETVSAYPNQAIYEYIMLLLDNGGDVFARNKWGRSPTAYAMMRGFETLWLRALVECSLHYDLPSFLAEDHARWHRWRATESSHEGRRHEKPSGQRDTGDSRQETHSAVDPIAHREDNESSFSGSSSLQFCRCSDLDCEWEVWKHLDIVSTCPFGHVIIEWAIGDHTLESLSQKTYSCMCDKCLFSQSSRMLDEEADGNTDPMDDDLEEEESPQSTNEVFGRAASSQVYSMMVSQDNAPRNSTSFSLPLHSALADHSRPPIASVSDHQSPDSSSMQFAEDTQYCQDQTMQSPPRYLEPPPFFATDPQLCFNPWNEDHAERQ
ncbi:palmitoyltransferase akr1 [Xylographa soralifera]|nr:palmitoyltransferase akr1 [Xylographa soralifera]